ncbi:hypothetical protein C5748_10420 [Phyllobacterium phragmitis]|uniref:Uncharacterized protein n=1 Tax=Phyllobacterium phragmitis TaxID=2670329 RepID=A0A2S9IT01_9HYPH|nr:hypothetical protein C5748_10420 [Phyllobacterium phragmitis]
MPAGKQIRFGSLVAGAILRIVSGKIGLHLATDAALGGMAIPQLQKLIHTLVADAEHRAHKGSIKRATFRAARRVYFSA